MSKIHKRHVLINEAKASPKKSKIVHDTEEKIQDIKLKIEKILKEYPKLNNSCTQNITVVENCPTVAEENAHLNYFMPQVQTNTLNSANLIEIPLLENENNYSSPSDNTQSTLPHRNLIYLTGAPENGCNNSFLPKNNSDLNETDLQILLQNFYKLEGKEQQILISHLKKLEKNEPDLVEKLNKFVRVCSPKPDKNPSPSDDDEDLNDLDDLDDILDETAKFSTDSESEDDLRTAQDIVDCESKDDCVVVDMFSLDNLGIARNIPDVKIKSKNVSKEEHTVKPQKIKINLLPKHLKKDEQVTNNIIDNLDHIIMDGNNKVNLEKRTTENNTNSERVIDRIIQKDEPKIGNNSKNQAKKIAEVKLNKTISQKQKRSNNICRFIQNPYENYSEANLEIDQEIQAKNFGYKDYKEMKQYLEITGTGIYCTKDTYFSFSDNA